jgi:hypothetical protein
LAKKASRGRRRRRRGKEELVELGGAGVLILWGLEELDCFGYQQVFVLWWWWWWVGFGAEAAEEGVRRNFGGSRFEKAEEEELGLF